MRCCRYSRPGDESCPDNTRLALLFPLIEPYKKACRARLQFIYTQTQGRRYDWLGAAGIIIRTRQRPHQWFCSEWCAYVLDYPEPHRISPNTLARLSAPGAKP